MKDIYFNQLKENDIVWVVYDKNYKHYNCFTYSNYIPELVLTTGKIIRNELEKREISYSDHYEDDEASIIYEYNIQLKVNGFNCIYSRYYSDFYNKKGQMLLTPPYDFDVECNPNIDIFTNKDLAKEYIIDYMNRLIESSTKLIDENKTKIEIYNKCIDEVKNK